MLFPKLQEVAIDNFTGSLDVLLQLAKQSEIPIEGVTLANMTSQLVKELLDKDDEIDVGAEILAQTATLLLIKSRSLLPVLSDPSELLPEALPAKELMQHVVDYVHFRAVGEDLAQKEEQNAGRYYRLLREKQSGAGELRVDHLALSDLVDFVERVLQKQASSGPSVLFPEIWTVAEAQERIKLDLATESNIPLERYFCTDKERAEMIVLLLAILELMKLQLVRVINEALVSA